MEESGDNKPDIFTKLSQYVQEKLAEFPPLNCKWYQMNVTQKQSLAMEIINDTLNEARTSPYLSYPCLRDWSNVSFHPGYGLVPVEHPKLSHISGESLMKFTMLLEIIRDLIVTNRRTTKRDIYYQMFVNFSSQVEVDRLISVAVTMCQE